MKICPKCQKTYSDAGLNFCLEDGTTLNDSNSVDNSLSATVLLNQPRPTNPNQSFGGQPSPTPAVWGSSTNQSAPNQFSMQPPPKKSKTWLWAVGIIGGLILLCGGGFTGFVFWAASLENVNPPANTSSPGNSAQTNSAPVNNKSVQKIDLSKWVKGDTDIGVTEFTNGEFLMGSKNKGYYYVLASQAIYKTENATTRVTVKNVNEEDTSLGFGLVVHSNPVPLTQGYAFLIDSENKKYRVVRHVPGDEIVVVGWTRSSAIKGGIENNDLEVRDQNKKMNFYINGEFIKAFDNEDGYSGGVTGLYSGDAVQIAFSKLEISK